MVVPVDPFEGGEFDRFEAPPGTAPSDGFGLDPPMMDSAKACPRLDRGALSQESPTRPTEGSTLACASRSVYRSDRYCPRGRYDGRAFLVAGHVREGPARAHRGSARRQARPTPASPSPRKRGSARPRIDHEVRRGTTSSRATVELRLGEIRRRLGAVSFARRSSRFSRSSSSSRRRSSLVTPARTPRSRSACRTHLRRVSDVHPSFDDTETIADHCESCSP